MGIVLDTSVLIAAERRRLRLRELLMSVGNEPVALTAITASELLHGCHRATDAGMQARRFAFVEALLTLIPVLEFGLVEARRHADIGAQFAQTGIGVGAHDLIIGATCIARGHALATLNAREFSWFPGLRLVPLERFAS